jgi:sarcosine oxidase
MPRESYDAIVLGLGGVGSAAAFELARRGARVLGIEQFTPAHDRGSSHGETRIIRQAYFEHPDYVPLLRSAYERWSLLESATGRRLFHRSGLLQIGPPEGHVVRGVVESARLHGLVVETLNASEIAARFPAFHIPGGLAGVYEPTAGILFVEACVQAHLDGAASAGAQLRFGEIANGWSARNGEVNVETSRGGYAAGRLVIAAGPWSAAVLADLAIPLEVRKKPQYWFLPQGAEYDADRGCPTFLFELSEGVFYGFPRLDEWGLKVARHSGGPVVENPHHVTRNVDPDERLAVEAFLTRCLPFVSRRCFRHSVCMYTMSPDEHFIVDRHPAHPEVVFAAGLSGHGFKFTGVLGAALADLALEGQSCLPIDFLRVARPALQPLLPNRVRPV